MHIYALPTRGACPTPSSFDENCSKACLNNHFLRKMLGKPSVSVVRTTVMVSVVTLRVVCKAVNWEFVKNLQCRCLASSFIYEWLQSNLGLTLTPLVL